MGKDFGELDEWVKDPVGNPLRQTAIGMVSAAIEADGLDEDGHLRPDTEDDVRDVLGALGLIPKPEGRRKRKYQQRHIPPPHRT